MVFTPRGVGGSMKFCRMILNQIIVQWRGDRSQMGLSEFGRFPNFPRNLKLSQFSTFIDVVLRFITEAILFCA